MPESLTVCEDGECCQCTEEGDLGDWKGRRAGINKAEGARVGEAMGKWRRGRSHSCECEDALNRLGTLSSGSAWKTLFEAEAEK